MQIQRKMVVPCMLLAVSLLLFSLPTTAAVSPASEMAFAQDSSRFIGTYRREFVGASGRVVELLELKADLSAMMTGDYENRGSATRTGNWTFARNRVIVTFAPIDVGGTPLVLEFTRTGGGWFSSGNNLKLRSSNPSGFAAVGVVYKRIRKG